MASGSVGKGASARRIVGLLLLLAAPSIAAGVWYSTRDPLEELARLEQRRTSSDSIAYASALYHATYARATEANRWHLTGYATLGLAGTVLGASLLLSIARGAPPEVHQS